MGDASLNNCDPLATCTNLDITAANNDGSYDCNCNDGYQKPANGNNVCKDIDECDAGTAQCQENSTCANNDGSYDCTCNEGFELNADGTVCESTVVPECACDLKTQVCDEATGTCNCKPGYLISDTGDCVFDFSVCPEDVKQTEVTWSGKTMRRNFV